MSDSSGKTKADKLDESLLFLISLTSIIFTIIQAFSGGLRFLLYSIPLLIFGVIMPFYYGYWRGALEDSAIMRVRGWIYLFFGTIGYIFAVIYLSVWESLFPVARAGSMVLFLLSGYLSGTLIRLKILKRIFKLCDKKEVSLIDEEITRSTMNTVLFLLLSLLWCVTSFLNSEACRSSPDPIVCFLFTFLILPSFFLLLGIFYELHSQRMLKNYGKPYRIIVPEKELLEKHGRFIIALRFVLDFLLVFSILLAIIISLLEWKEYLFYAVAFLILAAGLSALKQFLFRRKIVFE
ncbi:MAG: hypothetical protein DSO07_02470 [Thermoproteota archaeon]|nr:MAG: hypothetical protein DSO07_02470 [Candidatus Korarchaeota archaeon]